MAGVQSVRRGLWVSADDVVGFFLCSAILVGNVDVGLFGFFVVGLVLVAILGVIVVVLVFFLFVVGGVVVVGVA